MKAGDITVAVVLAILVYWIAYNLLALFNNFSVWVIDRIYSWIKPENRWQIEVGTVRRVE